MSRSDFYPRPPRGGRHHRPVLYNTMLLFLSTPSARRATYHKPRQLSRAGISIHALREEGDRSGCAALRNCGGFLSTPSARRATRHSPFQKLVTQYFYPRPPRGGRHARGGAFSSRASISIHALREEGDSLGHDIESLIRNFYPRPPRGGRQEFGIDMEDDAWISIHALREEGDPLVRLYSRHRRQISIHALREEGDHLYRCRMCTQENFYPRPPRGGRPGGL